MAKQTKIKRLLNLYASHRNICCQVFFTNLVLQCSNMHNFLQKLFFYTDETLNFLILYGHPTASEQQKLGKKYGLPYEALAKYGAESRTRTGTSLHSRDFKSLASTYSAIPAHHFWRRHPDLNRGSRFCRPVPYHLAMPPHIIQLSTTISKQSKCSIK